MSIDRFDLVKESFEKKAVPAERPEGKTSDYYGELVFDRPKMHKYLDAKTLNALLDCIDNGKSLDRETADGVAKGMKEWAMEHHVTHVTHWFQPLTEGTAEKHDSLIDYDGKGGVIETFDGKSLAQQEPDASSFPNGGIRATFEARGYTAWDPTSPVFIMDDTLCIPTVFISYTGEALDYKTPLKKALKAVSDAATPICRLFDKSVTKVYSYLGWEQEYFLVDESLYAARPDLMITGRTLMGHSSSKNQQLDDHYFGAIPSRVAEFMRDLEIAGHRLGIPLKTRHNEVAPNQFELAPIFGETNLANDQNQLVMNLMNKIARKHGFVVLLHEKPFAGVNGSGKHNNWSLGTDTGTMLLAPGKDAKGNLQFVTFFVNVLAAVQKHNALLKASIATATNAHRLGANEAPPAIVSAFLGRTMTDVLHKLLVVPSDTPIEIAGKKGKSVGLVEIPEIFVDNTDRNRTSPFAFTGNRFEFRAVGSSANCASAQIVLNTAVAEALTSFKERVDALIAKGEDKFTAILSVVKDDIKTCAPIHFDGNGYSDEWVEEAGKRGLDTEKSAPVIFDRYLDPESVKMFESMSVMKENELKARNEVKWETFTKKLQIEARVLGDLSLNHIIPVATHYQAMLSKDVQNLMVIYGAEKGKQLSDRIMNIIEQISERTAIIEKDVEDMVNARKVANKIADEREKAVAYHDTVETWFQPIRYQIDKLELVVADELWTLPKYRELLFIR